MPVQPTSYRRLLPKFSFPLRETFAQGQINAFGLDGFSEAGVGLSSWLFGAKSWRLRSDHLGRCALRCAEFGSASGRRWIVGRLRIRFRIKTAPTALKSLALSTLARTPFDDFQHPNFGDWAQCAKVGVMQAAEVTCRSGSGAFPNLTNISS